MVNAHIVGRKDQGIQEIADLKGKKVGLARGTVVEFYLGRFLSLHVLNLQDVSLVNVAPAQFVDAIDSGDVDALAAWQPYVSNALQQNGDGLVDWPINNGQPAYGILVARNDWVGQHQSAVERFLKSLADAESFIAHNPEKAKTIVQDRLNYDSAYIDSIWPDHHFLLSLDSSLVLALNDEARWLTTNNLTTNKQVPNFLKYVHEDELKTVRPEAVNIIR